MPTITSVTNPQLFPLYYEKKLLEYVKENLVVLRYGQKYSFQTQSGRTARFTRFVPLSVSTTPITDLPTPTSGASISSQYVEASINEYGNYIDLDEFSDITAFTPLLDISTDLLSYNSQQVLDKVGMNEITNGTNVIYAGGVTSRSSLDGTKLISQSNIRNAVNLLQRQNIQPYEDGYYVCFIHPDKLLELFTENNLITLANAKLDTFEKGVVAQAFGVKFVITTAMPIVTNGGTPPKDVYLTMVIGKNSYGVVDLDGNSIQMSFTNLDKLGRIKTVGWKAYFTAKRLYEPALVRIESN
ncbi:MAG: N4-gp56 family major capsid protein [Candidatus Dojkabacteria bacterium]|nr:N4-gp56 family major capsid protein [Candidatus Dojkabacteria bacterium]